MMALIGQYVFPVVAAIVALFSVWFAAKTKGKADERVKAAEQRSADQEQMKVQELERMKAQTETEVKTVGAANEAVTEVNSMPDADVLNELHRDYSKD